MRGTPHNRHNFLRPPHKEAVVGLVGGLAFNNSLLGVVVDSLEPKAREIPDDIPFCGFRYDSNQICVSKRGRPPPRTSASNPSTSILMTRGDTSVSKASSVVSGTSLVSD